MISKTFGTAFRRLCGKPLISSRRFLRLNRQPVTSFDASSLSTGNPFLFRNGFEMQLKGLSTTSKSDDNKWGMITNENELPMSDFAVAVASERNRKLREVHHRFVTEYPDSAQPDDGSKVDPNFAHRKKLIYRSKQRGWLEVDLLMGSWAEDNVMSLTENELKQYEDIINLETLDIYNIVTKQIPVPEGLDGPVLKRLQEYALSSPAGIADPQKYSEIKKKMSN